MKDPCDYPDANGEYHCPYEEYSESERCRVCCGHGVDEDEVDYASYYEEEEYE